jgi:radical SAM protein with 4Fe4S-binding SPASM domain
MANFDYTSDYFWRLALAHDAKAPMQLELHPGLNCGLYRCQYCFGHGQALNPGRHLSAEEYDAIAASLGEHRPTVIISGIATEPLTHPESPGILRAFRRRGFPVGLYTKGHKLTAEVRAALVDGPGECFVTVSLDAGTAVDYDRVHNIAPSKNSELVHAASFENILSNIRALSALKRKVKPDLKLRASILIFEEMAQPGKLAEAVQLLQDHVDLIRVAIAQDRNDGNRIDTLPQYRDLLLSRFEAEFANNPKVAILMNSHTPTRSTAFKHCVVQRTQVTIDKSGNVFPCPQVALAPYQHLRIGNVRKMPLPEILGSAKRRAMFELDIDSEMKCRICDRKDEAVNAAVGGHFAVFNRVTPGASVANSPAANAPDAALKGDLVVAQVVDSMDAMIHDSDTPAIVVSVSPIAIPIMLRPR